MVRFRAPLHATHLNISSTFRAADHRIARQFAHFPSYSPQLTEPRFTAAFSKRIAHSAPITELPGIEQILQFLKSLEPAFASGRFQLYLDKGSHGFDRVLKRQIFQFSTTRTWRNFLDFSNQGVIIDIFQTAGKLDGARHRAKASKNHLRNGL